MTDTTPAAAFIDRLDALVRRLDRGRLAALRKLVSAPETWGPDVYAAGIPLLPGGLSRGEERTYLSVAGLHALWHRGRTVPAQHTGTNVGAAMRRLAGASTSGSEAVERRVAVLLSSSGERLQHHLRQTIGQLATRDIAVDFVVLLRDLLHWDHRDHWVQRSWARGFWGEAETAPVTEKEPA